MIEVNARQPEQNPQQSDSNAFETARERHPTQQEAQIHPSVMPPASQEEDKKFSEAKPKEHSAEEHGQTGEEHKTGQGKQKSTWTPRGDDLVNEISNPSKVFTRNVRLQSLISSSIISESLELIS